jgi:MFS family permease
MPDPATDAGSTSAHVSRGVPESPSAWTRLAAALVLSAIGGVGMWSVIVALPAVQAEFGVARSAASLPYTMTMICFGVGSILMGRFSDRFGSCSPCWGRRHARRRPCRLHQATASGSSPWPRAC